MDNSETIIVNDQFHVQLKNITPRNVCNVDGAGQEEDRATPELVDQPNQADDQSESGSSTTSFQMDEANDSINTDGEAKDILQDGETPAQQPEMSTTSNGWVEEETDVESDGANSSTELLDREDENENDGEESTDTTTEEGPTLRRTDPSPSEPQPSWSDYLVAIGILVTVCFTIVASIIYSGQAHSEAKVFDTSNELAESFCQPNPSLAFLHSFKSWNETCHENPTYFLQNVLNYKSHNRNGSNAWGPNITSTAETTTSATVATTATGVVDDDDICTIETYKTWLSLSWDHCRGANSEALCINDNAFTKFPTIQQARCFEYSETLFEDVREYNRPWCSLVRTVPDFESALRSCLSKGPYNKCVGIVDVRKHTEASGPYGVCWEASSQFGKGSEVMWQPIPDGWGCRTAPVYLPFESPGVGPSCIWRQQGEVVATGRASGRIVESE